MSGDWIPQKHDSRLIIRFRRGNMDSENTYEKRLSILVEEHLHYFFRKGHCTSNVNVQGFDEFGVSFLQKRFLSFKISRDRIVKGVLPWRHV